MTAAPIIVSLGLLAAALAAAAFPGKPTTPEVRIGRGDAHGEAVQDGWVATDFSGGGVRIEVQSAPGVVTHYGAVISLVNHASSAQTVCLSGSAGAAPLWTLHGDGLHWESGQEAAALVTLAPGEERQVEVMLDWRDASAPARPVRWEVVPVGEPECRLLP